jgi:polar amino acid transport system substrate-binding protein
MQQLTQQLKSGKMEILEVPFPALSKNTILVRNHYSVISAGTEGKTVTDARKGYLAKARSRQKEVRMVIDLIKTQGLRETYNLVMNKLEAASPLGYSCAGEVIAVGENVRGFTVGDRVACGGAGANHADVVAVPQNLCVRVPGNVELKQAAFATIAAIAIQGIRQAELPFGSSCVVIGLGLIGQLTLQILEATGIRAIGIDIDPGQVGAVNRMTDERAALHQPGSAVYPAPRAVLRSGEGLESFILEWSGGFGTDAVIITASTNSTDPVDLAGILCRKKGKVVIVGGVPTGFSREHYYRKELDLRMSSSYGPGRYDPLYEEKGVDYPIGYVRFTENRNMQSFLDLVSAGKLDIGKLITHEFDLAEAPDAYEMILSRSEPYSGIVIRYETGTEPKNRVTFAERPVAAGEPGVGLIGAGNFAQNMLLPRMKGLCSFAAIATARGAESRYVADKYGFAACYDNGDDVIRDERVNTVFVLTRHNLHADYVIRALMAGKHVYVEKPLAMSPEELEKIAVCYRSAITGHRSLLMVGYNRRFSPAVQHIKKELPEGLPRAIHIRINAGAIPADHWANDPEEGGGRIIGEACHFIDLAMYLSGSPVVSVSAEKIRDPRGLNDTLVMNLMFEDGSIAGISYFSNGNKKVPKELIEVFCGGIVFQVNDFRYLQVWGARERKIRFRGQDKGHAAEIREFLDAIRKGRPSPISFEELHNGMLATFSVLGSLRENRKILIPGPAREETGTATH